LNRRFTVCVCAPLDPHENMIGSNSSGFANVIDDDAFEPAPLAVIAVRRNIH